MRYILDPLITETETCHCFNPILKIVGCSVKAQQLRAKYHQNHLIYPSKKGRLNSLSPTIYVHIIYIYIIMYLYTFCCPMISCDIIISIGYIYIYVFIMYMFLKPGVALFIIGISSDFLMVSSLCAPMELSWKSSENKFTASKKAI